MRELQCLRCNTKMQHIMDTKLQMGETSWSFGTWSNLCAGAIEVAIYTCPNCGKIEFFHPDDTTDGTEIAQLKCPQCGRRYDADYPKCPFCHHSSGK